MPRIKLHLDGGYMTRNQKILIVILCIALAVITAEAIHHRNNIIKSREQSQRLQAETIKLTKEIQLKDLQIKQTEAEKVEIKKQNDDLKKEIELKAKQSTPVAVVPKVSPIQNKPLIVPGGSIWDKLAQCEASGNWAINTGNGFYGGLQFTLSSWKAAGGTGMPHLASKSEQIKRGEILQKMQGWGAWPACSSKLGL